MDGPVTTSDDTPLRVWVVSDGRAGIENQGLGLAEALAALRPIELSVKRVGWRGGLGALSWWLNLAPLRSISPDSDIAPP